MNLFADEKDNISKELIESLFVEVDKRKDQKSKELDAISKLIHYPNDWEVEEFPTMISALEYLLESYLNNCSYVEGKK
jgi:hypothetical protein